MEHKKIAYILGSFPGGTPPFIINEIKGVQKEGIEIIVCPIHKRDISGRDANINGIKTLYADPIFSPKIMMAHFYYLFRKPIIYFKLLLRNKVFGGKKIFWEGVYYARAMEKMGMRHIHAHFAWSAADCARIINKLTDIPFSLTAHQSDIHRFPERLSEKLEDAKFILTCTRGNKEYLAKKYGEKIGGKISVIYHGIDLSQFSPDIRKKEKDIDILSIGSLIKCKGFEYLIEACAQIKDRGLFRKCIIVGEGEDKDSLEALIWRLGLSDKMEIKGPVSHSEVTALYERAKSFILPITIIDGAPHGVPNVLAEAMAMGLPVITTHVPHIPELIENNKNGLLVVDKNLRELADAIGEILSNENLRSRLGEEARTKIISDFDGKIFTRRIADLFLQCA
ncbi:MAG: glycosyltransferase family 4 protein [Patescibacteria group bacterium]|jgi:glycosyltransferase involved in cell wall biosynthesis